MLKLGNSAGKFPGNAGNNRLSSGHKRQVWLCEACDCSPAVFLCKADSAALCAACDSDIHSANPLARRHHRLPIPPSPLSPGLVMGLPEVDADDDFLTQEADETVDGEDEDEAASWLLLNPDKNGDNQINDNGPTSFGGVEDELLNFDDYSSCQNSQFNDQKQDYSVTQKSYGDDSFVPIQFHKRKNEVEEHYFQLGLDYESSNSGYNYPDSMSHNVALSPVDVGVVPESIMSGNSICHPRLPEGTIDLFSGAPIQTPTQLSPMDREARVLRYREKKKARKFEKTIRYASRKAYAETRPRIKGRFAKRRDVEVEVEQMFSTSLISENAYGIVPSF